MSSETKYLLDDRYLFDPKTRSIKEKDKQQETIWLGSNESNILLTFAQHSNELISRDMLHDQVWTDRGFHVDDSSVIQAISTLRKLLKDSVKSPSFIKTIPKQGYQFIANVKVMDENDDLNSETPSTPDSGLKEKNGVATNADAKASYRRSRFVLIAILVSIICVGLIYESKRSPFVVIDTIEGVAIKTLKEQQQLLGEDSAMKQCVREYLMNQPDKRNTTEVIVNSDARGSMLFHFVDKASKNRTSVSFVASRNELVSECSRVWRNYE